MQERQADKPNSEPDFILPSVDSFCRLSIWVDEEVVEFFWKDRLSATYFKTINHHSKRYTVNEFIEHVMQGDEETPKIWTEIVNSYIVEDILLNKDNDE